ncbi:carboxylesterase family protein [Anaerocolumna sp. AGMB13025]|uniref:carboxylesterase/lipase family protein n=1 Tax=Anaerocolumna sp. AGMB13025 TaxID=3039116 RepID=UPI00241F2BA3|nr:carboxylesterase family protein [Anaerocolumna sp. AGMB13025]WFR55724.1 carboxylesterase family protein [Anaerocolumna sp. AGMB13025]
MAKQFICSKTEPIVQTKQGKLRGFTLDGIYNFYGIKYADAKRFLMPEEPASWEGVRDALSYGYVCPMLQKETAVGELMVPHRYWPKDENCQYLNIWSPTLNPDAKKPVMVWLHGGGFSAGSSIEQIAYDGENMCRFGDTVIVSLNHRLNILGYLDLSPFGEKYANSGNAGNADIVAALRWIRDNIEQFGGDPENVTLFGQSGGGMKVWTLMQTPSADGLFHKGIIQSGVIDGFVNPKPQNGRKIVSALLKELNLKEEDIEQLETIPYEILGEAYKKVSPALLKAGEYVGESPIVNDFYLGDPRVIGFTEHAKTIPVMIGSVLAEFAFVPGIADKYSLSEEQVKELISQKYGEHAEKLTALFHTAYPDKHTTDLLFYDSLFRSPSKDLVLKKALHPESKTYSYLFAFEFPYDDGKPAWHCSEIPFVFHNTDKVPICNLPGVSDKLEEQMCLAWINFAKNGNPNNSLLPDWPASQPEDEAVMIFDRECTVKHNYDHELVSLHYEVVPNFFLHMAETKESEDEEITILH